MKFYSTNNPKNKVSLKEAVLKGLAEDKGLYMPEIIPQIPSWFFKSVSGFSIREIGMEICRAFFGEDIERNDIKRIVDEAMNFEIPLRQVHDNIYALELFHGPTCAFKDVGARMMARILSYFIKDDDREITVLVATSGDTGSAVANGFLGVNGIKVKVLYPKGLVSNIQEKQFTTLGQNVEAIEVRGTFDDCQRIVKEAFLDSELNKKLTLTSANSINLARLIPQSFYYVLGWAKMAERQNVYCAVPSGNFGNITSGLIAKRMGLPLNFIAATNINDVVPEYLQTKKYTPRPSVSTLSNAMDVGNPSNFARILDMYKNSHEAIATDMKAYTYTDDKVKQVIKEVYATHNYLLDPHGAIGYMALREHLKENEGSGFFIETAHPAKFLETIEEIIDEKVAIPERLQKFLEGTKQTKEISSDFKELKDYLLS